MHFPSRALIPIFGIAGALHFSKPDVFDAIVPPALPGSPRTYTYVSGVAELAAAVMLAAPALGPQSNPGHRRRSRGIQRAGGLFSAALLTAVWPANFYMAWQWRAKPWPQQSIAIARLPLQIPMIRAAWRVYKEGPLD